MKILVAHNAYQQRGGEDAVFDAECALLEKEGHQVHRLLVRNDHIKGLTAKVHAALSILRNPDSIHRMIEALETFKPDIVHIHNFFPTLSPAAIETVLQRGLSVILTLHNYRPLCVGGLLMRDNKPCEDCIGKARWRGIAHRCYRGSAIGSACVSLIGPALKKLLRTYPRALTLVALTHFAKARYIADGFPEDSLVVKGNSLADVGAGTPFRENKIVYVGRISPEKGVETLLQASQDIGGEIEIIGDGPDRRRLEQMKREHVTFLGNLPPESVIEHIKKATAIAMPSRWYEGFPMVALEAMATGTPLIASRLGSLGEIVQHGQTGILVDPFDPQAWQTAMRRALKQPDEMRLLGQQARDRFLACHSQETGLSALINLYATALKRNS